MKKSLPTGDNSPESPPVRPLTRQAQWAREKAARLKAEGLMRPVRGRPPGTTGGGRPVTGRTVALSARITPEAHAAFDSVRAGRSKTDTLEAIIFAAAEKGKNSC